jgi:drug/metabolite transporter (DMT)-like permease
LPRALQAHLALFIVALIYGANYTIAKDVMGQGYLSPLPFILLRIIAGSLLFWLFHLSFIREKVMPKDLTLLALCGLFGVAVNQAFFFLGLNWTSPINASLIMTTTPILVLVISAIILGERITGLKVFGIIIGAIGAGGLIAYGEEISTGANAWKGNLMVFINATSYGIYLVIVKGLLSRYHPITVVKWIFTFGLLYIIPFSYEGLLATDFQHFPSHIWLAIVYVLLATTFLAYLLNAFALTRVNPSVVSIYIYLQPLLATVVAVLAGSDQLSNVKLIAAAFIFAGVYMVSYRRKTKAAETGKGET